MDSEMIKMSETDWALPRLMTMAQALSDIGIESEIVSLSEDEDIPGLVVQDVFSPILFHIIPSEEYPEDAYLVASEIAEEGKNSVEMTLPLYGGQNNPGVLQRFYSTVYKRASLEDYEPDNKPVEKAVYLAACDALSESGVDIKLKESDGELIMVVEDTFPTTLSEFFKIDSINIKLLDPEKDETDSGGTVAAHLYTNLQLSDEKKAKQVCESFSNDYHPTKIRRNGSEITMSLTFPMAVGDPSASSVLEPVIIAFIRDMEYIYGEVFYA
ncbi:MAG: hypothetical protein J6N76_01230 [Lachnospiraceae bacterium]|nr:hypothetical protein [Lachnospiraceae bacterium]